MLATYRTSFAPIDASATASAKTWTTAPPANPNHASVRAPVCRDLRQWPRRRRRRRAPPGVAIRPPRRLERIAPEVRRRERERIEELDLAVGHDQQHRLRRFEPRLDLGDDVPRVDRQRRPRAGRRRALRERSHGLPPVLVTARDALPIVRGAPEAHQRTGDERAAAERRGVIEGRDDLVQVEPGGHEHPLRLETPGGETLDGANRCGKARTRAHAIVRGGGGPDHRDLDAPDG